MQMLQSEHRPLHSENTALPDGSGQADPHVRITRLTVTDVCPQISASKGETDGEGYGNHRPPLTLNIPR